MAPDHVTLQMGFLVKSGRTKIAEKRFFLVALVLLMTPQTVGVHVRFAALGAPIAFAP